VASVLAGGAARARWVSGGRPPPLSPPLGSARGTPVDRHYLHRFLDANRALVTGDVLEVQTTSYTQRFGHHLGRVASFDIVPLFQPTYLCDLAHSEAILPPAAFDCVLLPNTLQHLRELDACLANILRVVRPGGAILASAAGLLPLTGDVPDLWRFSPDGWREKLSQAWRGTDLEVAGHGNCLSAVASQFGLAFEELTDTELDVHDPRYPVLTTI